MEAVLTRLHAACDRLLEIDFEEGDGVLRGATYDIRQALPHEEKVYASIQTGNVKPNPAYRRLTLSSR